MKKYFTDKQNMKEFKKSSVITGVVLLLLASVFSIGLLLQPLDFGMAGPGHDNFFFKLGNMLYSVYGFSSIFIPVFLLLSGLSCFATKWTARKTMRFITALIPFFTCVLTENLCRSIIGAGRTEFYMVKLIVVILTGLVLVVLEFFISGILADKISKRTKKVKIVNDSNSDDEVSSESISYKKIDKFKIPESELKNNDYNVSSDKSIEDILNNDSNDSEVESVLNSRDESGDKDFSEINTNSIITEEEFAALNNPNPINPDDELEWKDLLPAVDKLPPEYDDDFDENDPALEFPPKEEPVNVNENVDTGLEEIDDSGLEEITEVEDNSDNDSFEEIGELNFDEILDNSDFDLPDEDDFQLEINNNDDEVIDESSQESFVKTDFDDSVVENPKYPHGIVIRDEDDDVEEEEETEKNNIVKQKYPRGIKLQSSDEPDDSDIDDYEEDVTLPFPDFDIEEPAINSELLNKENNNEENFEDITIDIPEDFNENSKDADSERAGSDFLSSGSDVFSDMEDDIRESKEKKTSSDNVNQIDKEFMSQFGNSEMITNDLTADELTDFFKAQQEENTPKTTEIVGNPVRLNNRAVKKGPYVISSDLLTAYKDDKYWVIDDATKQAALNLKQTLAEFNIEADITGIKKGPVVTMFEILPAPGVRLNKIVQLQDNIALSLAAQSVRIVAPIPGKQAVGIEVPNKKRSVVGFREIIEMDSPEWDKMAVPVILGKDILGRVQIIDLVKTPHMLIAGATGSGKSVCVNSLILSILYKRSYKDVKLILIDPKVVELKLYNDIPHLLTPVITEPKKALKALQYCLCEMERRYALLDSMGVRDITNYNQKIKEQHICTEKLPYIVVIIDEFADLMATSGKELESIVARLTAMSRAVGIHLVLATQRPSVNVITGLIKANIPTRIAFMVASRTDSNIIIDQNGAEKLLGRGDMLYASAVDPAPVRIQGTFVSDQEVENVVEAVKEYGEPDYLDETIFEDDEDERGTDLFGEPMSDDDPLYDQALEIVVQAGKASASYIQRRLKIGYNRAARIVEEMEERGIVGPANGSKPREIIHIP